MAHGPSDGLRESSFLQTQYPPIPYLFPTFLYPSILQETYHSNLHSTALTSILDGSIRGFAYIEFESADDAAEAIFNMNDSELYNRVIKVDIAKPHRGAGGLDSSLPGMDPFLWTTLLSTVLVALFSCHLSLVLVTAFLLPLSCYRFLVTGFLFLVLLRIVLVTGT
jgi:RNA recognition motif. (a.k.a. RRM, RBD, or RNP domain)